MAIMTHSCAVSASQAAGGTDIDVTVGSFTSYGLRLWGYYGAIGMGSRNPTAYEGHNITQIYGNYATTSFFITLEGSPANDVFSSVDVETGTGTVNLTSASASISGTTTKTWTWTSSIPDWESNASNPRVCTFYA